jgi:hypothetical protein
LPPSVIKKVQTATKPRRVRYGKAKGMRGQIWIANELARLLGIEWNQADDDSPIAVRPSGQHGQDLILRGLVKKALPFAIEAKWAESLILLLQFNKQYRIPVRGSSILLFITAKRSMSHKLYGLVHLYRVN